MVSDRVDISNDVIKRQNILFSNLKPVGCSAFDELSEKVGFVGSEGSISLSFFRLK